MKKYLAIILTVVYLLSGCDKGIAPLPEEPEGEKPGFSGTITFVGEWPDSAKRTHLVVFENPLISAGDFNALNLKYISSEIPFGTQIFQYSSNDSSLFSINDGIYRYVAVAQSATPEVLFDRKAWYVIGVYYANGDSSSPGTLIIPPKTLVKNINIICDYDNLPPQPPGGNL